MALSRTSWLIGLLLMLVTLVGAQTPDKYRLQQEDVLRIQILDEPQVNNLVTIGKDGNITAPFLGSIRAEGLTTSELERILAAEYDRVLRIRNPKVSVTIERFRPIRVSVAGLVSRPGTFEIRPEDNILSLLALGGGVILDRADLRRAKLQRAGMREIIPIDLYALLTLGDMSQNYTLKDGDALTVPEDKFNVVNVLGAVQQPFSFPYREGMTLIDAISQARGDIQFRSKFSDILIIRENRGAPGTFSRIRVNLTDFLRRGDSTQNPRLQKGDVIFVPESDTPDLNRIGTITGAAANFLFILDRFGVRLFR